MKDPHVESLRYRAEGVERHALLPWPSSSRSNTRTKPDTPRRRITSGFADTHISGSQTPTFRELRLTTKPEELTIHRAKCSVNEDRWARNGQNAGSFPPSPLRSRPNAPGLAQLRWNGPSTHRASLTAGPIQKRNVLKTTNGQPYPKICDRSISRSPKMGLIEFTGEQPASIGRVPGCGASASLSAWPRRRTAANRAWTGRRPSP